MGAACERGGGKWWEERTSLVARSWPFPEGTEGFWRGVCVIVCALKTDDPGCRVGNAFRESNTGSGGTQGEGDRSCLGES